MQKLSADYQSSVAKNRTGQWFLVGEPAGLLTWTELDKAFISSICVQTLCVNVCVVGMIFFGSLTASHEMTHDLLIFNCC